MSYLWEMVLRLKEKGFGGGDIFFKQADEFSPYYEQASPYLNGQEIVGSTLEINGLYRFGDIFGELFNPDLTGEEEFKGYLFDILIHGLVEIDLRKGLCKREYYIYKIYSSIRDGQYGKGIQADFEEQTAKDRYAICSFLLIQLETGSSLYLFTRVVKELFPDGVIYKDNTQKKQILIYLGQGQTIEMDTKMDLLVRLFLAVEFKVRLFYGHHFGILDVEETLELGNIEIL